MIDIYIIMHLWHTGEFRLATSIEGTEIVPGYGKQKRGFSTGEAAIDAIEEQGSPDNTYIPVAVKSIPAV